MAFAFVAAAHADTNTNATQTVNVPTGTQNNDIIFALLKGSAPFTAPSGWTHIADTPDGISGHTYALYYRVASSEPASYDWTANSGSRFGVTHATYRDGFDTADPIDVFSDTQYNVDNTTLRAAGMTVSAANSPLIFLGGCHSSSSKTFTPPTNPTTFAEDVDTWNTGSRFGREIASVVWSGSGATGDMDATISATVAGAKHAFAVALNPAAGGTTYNESISEAATASDSVAGLLTAGGALSESGSASDSLASAAELVGALTEVATATDSLTGLLEAAGVLSEAGSAADTIANLAVLIGALSEAGNATDAISQGGAVYEVSLSEAASAADTIAGLLEAVGALSETGSAADTLASQAVLAAALSEAAAAIDNLVGLGVLSVALVEAGNATDSLTSSGQVVASTQRLIEVRLADRTVRVDFTGRVISVQLAPRTIN